MSSCLLFAQSNDSVDVKAMVKKQILLAQQKTQNAKKMVPTKSAIVTQPKIKNQIADDGISTATIVKILVLLIASLVAAGIILKRRYKLRKIENRIKLKQNVKQLREEQLVKKIDPRLTDDSKKTLSEFELFK
jgi:uncharacterized membrane protein YciS (DUF1049 family)